MDVKESDFRTGTIKLLEDLEKNNLLSKEAADEVYIYLATAAPHIARIIELFKEPQFFLDKVIGQIYKIRDLENELKTEKRYLKNILKAEGYVPYKDLLEYIQLPKEK